MKILVRTIGTRRKFNAEYFLSEMRNTMTGEVQRKVTGEFQKTVRGWKNPPEFSYALTMRPDEISVVVFPYGPNANKYAWVNFGTPGRMIYPKKAKALAFRPGYRPATRPGVLGSRAYTRSGKTVFSKGHWWPGIKARRFDVAVSKIYQPQFRRDVENALRRAARRL